MSESLENLTVVRKEGKIDNLKKDEMSMIVSDFQNLDFSENFSEPDDVMNYNQGKQTNPFDKISKYYGRNKNVFLFISLLRKPEFLQEIIDIVDQKCDAETKDKFLKRLRTYLDRIDSGEKDAKDFLAKITGTGDCGRPDAFFNGYHVGPDRNIHENLNINVTKPQTSLNINDIFSGTIERINEEKSELKRLKIYVNGKRILTVVKNGKWRNYSFTKFETHHDIDLSIAWNAKAKSENEVQCSVTLQANLARIQIKDARINSESVDIKDILEMGMQNEAVRFGTKTLQEILEASCCTTPLKDDMADDFVVVN